MDSTKPHSDIVRLNVGGRWFSTTRSTLLGPPGSIFVSMLNPEVKTTGHLEATTNQQNGPIESLHEQKSRFEDESRKEDNGYYFIDRDGELFRYILNYLRDGLLLLPSDFKEHAQLRSEAQFYGLPDLAGKVQKQDFDSKELQFVEIVEASRPEKAGLSTARVTLNSSLMEVAPFCDIIYQNNEEYETFTGDAGRSWIRTRLTRLDWGEELSRHGWKAAGSVAFCRKLPDVTGRGTDMVHIIEKWCKNSSCD